MRAVQITEFGGPEVLQFVEIPPPEPSAGEVLIRVASAGVNYADIRMRAGSYVRKPPLPAVLGFEASGYVEAVGPGAEALVTDPSVLDVGAAVIAGDVRGGYAEFAIAPADLLFPVPTGKLVEDAAALPVNYLVAWLAVHGKGEVRSGETVLVHAAGGGVGSAAVQIARLAGARVVATASTPEKLEIAKRAGADITVNYLESDFVDEIRNRLGSQRPIDLVIDSVGGPTLVGSLELLARWGRLVGFGQASDTAAQLDLYTSLIPQQLDLRFLGRGSLTTSRNPRDRARLFDAMQRVTELWAMDKIHPAAVERLPMTEVREVHARMGSRSHSGKILLDPAV